MRNVAAVRRINEDSINKPERLFEFMETLGPPKIGKNGYGDVLLGRVPFSTYGLKKFSHALD